MLGAMAQTPVETVPSVCPHVCTSTCALEVERLDLHTIGRVRGSHRNTYTRGVICEKVGRYAERVHHPDRLLHPLRRVGPKGSGHFERIAWDDALDLVAEAFTRQAARLGLETVWPYYYAGTMGLVQRDGINRLTHAMGYSRYFSTICVTLADTGWAAGVGAKRGVDLREIGEHSDLVVIWGGNPVNTQVNVMSHAMQAKRRGATFVVVDPYRTDTAAKADLHLAPRPGTDGALACAVMHVLFAEGLADWDYLRAHTDCPDELAAHVAARPPAWAATITGLDARQIVEFARLYGRTKKSFIRCHHGFSRSRNGAVNMHAVSCLPAITGAWQYPGGGAVYGQTALYPLDRSLIEGLDLVDKSIRALDQSRLGPILTGDPAALLGGPPVTAMLVQNTNPAMVCPETHLVHRGLAREDLFLCVHEQFLTETAAFADIVLPATMFVEHDDFYTASGHTYFQVTKKVIERYGERGATMPTLPDHFAVTDEATADKPFRLVAAPARTFLNSSFTETPSSLARERRPTALLHPDDCAALGAVSGTALELGNERGRVIVHAEAREGQQRGVVIVEGVWPNKHFVNRLGINALTSAEPGYPNGGAVFHDTAVWIRRVDLDG